MRTHISAGDRPSLAIEVGTGTLYINGEGIELPPREFQVFLALARNLGATLSTADLLEEAWDNAYGITARDVHWQIWKIRDRIGDKAREEKIVANRRGFGYFIDLPPDRVQLIEDRGELYTLEDHSEGEGSTEQAPDDILEVVEDRPDNADPVTLDDEMPVALTELPPPAQIQKPAARMSSKLIGAVAAGTVVLAMAAIWTNHPFQRPTDVEQGLSNGSRPPSFPRRDSDDPQKPRKGSRGGDKEHDRRETGTPAVVAAGGNLSGGSASQPSQQQSSHTKDGTKKTAPALPAPPAQLLLHLFDPDSGDHFMTTDGAVASEYEGRGYERSAIASVYSQVASGTKPITLNVGSAYIFSKASPDTEPRISTIPLWLLSDGNGDFYYSTSNVQPDGWSSSLIGYVRAP